MESVADTSSGIKQPFYTAKNERLCAISGRYDLYYFEAKQDAEVFASQYESAWVIETSANQIWRATVPSRTAIGGAA